jgi:flagella synthesis protein FlgN
MNTAPSLTNALHQEQQLITTLLDVLKEEQDHLVSANADGLAEVTPRKTDLVHQMSQLASQRHQALGAAGFPAQETGMQAWLAAANDPHAAASWHDLLAKTREAKELNRLNGMLIAKQMANNQVLLNAMKLTSAETDAATYGPTGQTTAAGPSRRYVIG